MLTVTNKAMEKLEETLDELTTDPEVMIRIISSTTEPHQLDLVLDQEREGDRVVENEKGRKLFLVGTELAEDLEEMTFDYQESEEGDGDGFTIQEN